jgi:zinc transport system substrate-binding protein
MIRITILLLFTTTYIFSNINAVVSILPQKTFLKAIAGNKVNITLMVLPGNSPHTYEPKPSQMIKVSKATLYFTMGVEFENVWLPKFKNLNTQMQVIDLRKGIEIQAITQGDHDCSTHSIHKHISQNLDPHVWTSPSNVKIIAKNIYDALVQVDVKNATYYKNNLKIFLASVDETDAKIKSLLSDYSSSRTFMVFHPSWGYFAKAYFLEQVAVEMEGKSPKPREIVQLIKKAKDKKVTAIFTQSEFSDSTAKTIANELNIPVVKISPMASNWSENLIRLTKTIAGKQ